MILPVHRISWQVIQQGLYNMFDVVKWIIHGPLKIISSVLQSKWKFTIWKCVGWIDKRCFRLIGRECVYLIVTRESIHEWNYFVSCTTIKNFVDVRGGIILFGTSFINIPIIDTYYDSSLFLRHWNYVRYPIHQWNRINETYEK